jgi:hypothetical protein
MKMTFALAIAHAGSCTLANGLRAVNGQRSVAGSNNLGFCDLLALADDIVASRSSLRHR